MKKQLSFALVALSTLFSFATLHAKRGERTGIAGQDSGPWFTGPLLAPSGHVVPIGYTNFEPYLFVTDIHGDYNKHWHSHSIPKIVTVNPQFLFWIGIAKAVDIQISPQFTYAKSQGRSSTEFNDFAVTMDFQLLKDEPGKWYPAIKFAIREIFPTGKYQKMNPHKHGTDEGGGGSYVTGFNLVISRLFHLSGIHYLNFRISNSYNIPTSVHVKGFNAYGGGYGTNGRVRPGNFWVSIIGTEFTLSKHWALANDIAFTYNNKNSFSGKKGRTATGAIAHAGEPSSAQFSLAPALEYNFNESVGIIGGVWFSFAGRNAPDFVSGVIAVNWFNKFKK